MLELLECAGRIDIDQSESPWRVMITTSADSRRLIGVRGAHLQALQHLVRCIVSRLDSAETLFTLDVNGYRRAHEETMRLMAEKTAAQASRQGRTVVLDPMSAADRRLIHTALSTRSDIRTESLGEEPNRRVVVRPIFL